MKNQEKEQFHQLSIEQIEYNKAIKKFEDYIPDVIKVSNRSNYTLIDPVVIFNNSYDNKKYRISYWGIDRFISFNNKIVTVTLIDITNDRELHTISRPIIVIDDASVAEKMSVKVGWKNVIYDGIKLLDRIFACGFLWFKEILENNSFLINQTPTHFTMNSFWWWLFRAALRRDDVLWSTEYTEYLLNNWFDLRSVWQSWWSILKMAISNAVSKKLIDLVINNLPDWVDFLDKKIRIVAVDDELEPLVKIAELLDWAACDWKISDNYLYCNEGSPWVFLQKFKNRFPDMLSFKWATLFILDKDMWLDSTDDISLYPNMIHWQEVAKIIRWIAKWSNHQIKIMLWTWGRMPSDIMDDWSIDIALHKWNKDSLIIDVIVEQINKLVYCS